MRWRRECPGARASRFAADQDGAAILEFALVLPVLVLLAGATYEVGRALLIRVQIEAAVQAGARYLARVPDPECRPGCSPGAARAVRLTAARIADATGIPPERIAVAPDPAPPRGTVVLTAATTVGSDIFSLAGLGPAWTLRVAHAETRVAP